MRHTLLVALPLLLTGCQVAGETSLPAGPRKDGLSEVIVLGMIHDGHVTSQVYGTDEVSRLVRAIDPDYILAEIPPDRLDDALESFHQTGMVTEERVERFPEYKDAIIPLTREMEFEIVPCAAWTAEMASERRAHLTLWKETRPKETEEVDRAQIWLEETLERDGLAEDPRGIHSARYDALVKEGLEPYDRLFNDDLGLGGWTNINAAHYALIADALDRRRGEGLRFLVTFGSWHKYWILERLNERDDVVVVPVERFLAE